MFARQQPQTDQTPLIPPTAEPSPRRPTADEWFHAVSDEPSASESHAHQAGSQKKPVLAAVGVLALLAITAISIIWMLTTNDDNSDLTQCDTWLRTQFVNYPEITTSTRNANAAVAAIQEQRTADCPRNAWNPLVSNITKTPDGNIEVRFATVGRTSNGQSATMTAAGQSRWIYMAAEDRWHSVPAGTLPALAVKPTNTSPPRPPLPSTTTPPTETANADHDPQPKSTASPTATMAPAATASSPTQPRAPNSDDNFSGPAAALIEQGRELFKKEDYRAAAEAFAAAQLRHGKPSQVLENQTGMALRRLEDHPQAIDHFTKAIELKDNPVDRIERALSYIATRQCAKALQDASRALEMQPESTDGFHTEGEAHAALSTCHLKAGDTNSAVKHAEAAVAVTEREDYPAERLANAHIAAANAYALAKSHGRAIEHYSTALELNDNAEAHAGRAWVYRDRRNCNAALADAGEAMSLPAVSRNGYHSGAEASWIFVVCLEEADSRATQHVETALRFMEENGYTTGEIAERNIWGATTLFNHGRYPDAVRYLSESIELHDTAAARVSRAVAHHKSSNCNEAIEDSNQALEMPAENWLHYRSGDHLNSWAEANATLALCYTAERQPEAAMQHVESALIYMRQASYKSTSIEIFEEFAKDLRNQIEPPDAQIRARYQQEGSRLHASRSSGLVWADGSNWVDGASHNFPVIPIPDGHLLKHHLTCTQRETLYLAVSRNAATFANLVWGNHPLATTLYQQNSFERECGSTMRTK